MPSVFRHCTVVRNTRQPQKVGTIGNRRKQAIADRDYHLLRHLVVTVEHFRHRKHVLVVITMDVRIVEINLRQQVDMRLLPVAGAKNDDVGCLLEAGNVARHAFREY